MTARGARGKWAYFFLVAGVGCVLAGVGVWFLVPQRYEVYALLKVAGRAPTVLQREGAPPADREEFAVFKRTQSELLHSNIVINGALRDGSINRLETIKPHGDDAVSWLRNQLTVDYPHDAEVMRISMHGERKGDLLKIVNKVVSVYLEEIVAREKELRLFQENKLSQTYAAMQSDLHKQLDSLHTLESLHRTSGSETAKLVKQMAVEELHGFMQRRDRILEEIRSTELELELEKARMESVPEVRTADDAAPAALAVPASLKLLEKKKSVLQEQLAQTNESVENQIKQVSSLESFSAQVASKQEDIRALQRVNSDLRSELDRIKLEKLAQERISKIDDAVVAPSQGDWARRLLVSISLALAGLLLACIGLVLWPRVELRGSDG